MASALGPGQGPFGAGGAPGSGEERFAVLVSLLTVCTIIFVIAGGGIVLSTKHRAHQPAGAAVTAASTAVAAGSATSAAVASGVSGVATDSSQTAAALTVPIADTTATSTLSSDQIVQAAMQSVAFVRAGDVEGTGFLVLKDGGKGYVLTNDHVVLGKASVTVVTADSRQHTGTVVASDEDVDLALVAIPDAAGLKALPLGDSDAVKVGDQLYVIGFALGSDLKGDPSVTRGILSGRRPVSGVSYLQTDAAVNHGNSGGPALNAAGEAVGIATWGFDAEEAQGINFLIPSRLAQQTINRLLASVTADPTASAWSALPAPPANVTGSGSSVWTGKQLITWGGERDDKYTNAGAIYDPATKTWKPTETTGAPSPRMGQATVWTGSALVIWGGEGTAGQRRAFFNDGARYHPATNTWTPIAPSPLAGRFGAHAVWTGQQVIVWGGEGMANGKVAYFNDGAGYDPATNKWSMLPASPLAPRADPAVVWTGKELLVWGGEMTVSLTDGSRPFGDGARFNPATNAWTILPPNGAPSPRGLMAAVWTGDELVVWGGQAGKSTLDDGGRFNPTTNQWTAIAPASGMQARMAPSAVWVAAEGDQPGRLVIWGGISGDKDAMSLSDGATYKPATGTWSPLPAAALSSRAGADAYWTGQAVLLWGGMHFNRGADIGSLRYTPDGALVRLP